MLAPTPSLRRLVARLSVLALLGLASALGGCGASSASGPASIPHRSAPELESIFEAATQLTAAPASTLDALRSLGVDRVRVDIRWANLAPAPTAPHRPAGFDPTDPNSYATSAWAPYDQIIRDARARGIGIDATVGGGVPRWAQGPGRPKGSKFEVWRPSGGEFAAFVTAVGKRYSGGFRPAGGGAPLPRIRFWSVWNEPNYGYDLAPQAIDRSRVEVSPRYYRRLLSAAWSSLHATGHGSDTILFGETAPRGLTTGDNPGNFSGMVPLRFLRALYCLDGSSQPLRGRAATERGCPADAAGTARFRAQNPALFDAAAFADHPYVQGQLAPNAPDPGGGADFAGLAQIPQLEQTLDRAQRAYGSHRKLSIYSTEFGYQTDPPEPAHLSPGAAAGYENWSEYISWREPRLRSFDQYLLSDPPGNTLAVFASGLEFASGVPKPTYDAFRMPVYLPKTTQAPGSKLLVWGCVRPAHHYGGGHAELQFAAGPGTGFTTLRSVPLSDPAGYFALVQHFPASGRLRIAWSYPHGQEIYSRAVSVSAPK